MLADILLEPRRDDVVRCPKIDPPHEVDCLDRYAVVVFGVGIKTEENRLAVSTYSPLLGHPGNHLTRLGVQLYQVDLDVVIKFPAEGIVRVWTKWTNGWRKRGYEIAESSPFFSFGITDLRLLQAVLPD